MNPGSVAEIAGRAAEQTSLLGLARLMRMAFSGVDLAPVGEKLIARAQTGSGASCANALMDLCSVLQLRGDHDLALQMQAQALHVRQLYAIPAAKQPPAIRLLALMGQGDLMANTPLEFLLENSDVELQMLYLAPDLPLPFLPEHDVLFVAIGQSDANTPLLVDIAHALQSWPRPVFNMPDRIALLSRDSACALLHSAPGVMMPQTARVLRQALAQIGLGQLPLADHLLDGAFPLIVRPVDSHAGRGLVKLDEPADIAAYLQDIPQDEFYLSRFVDYRGADGLFRKCRIVLIGGRPFVCHMAISGNWMIHYLNAGMTESAEKCAEEARFMECFDEEFALKHTAAFRAIYERMGLDYLGIDCAETPDGRLLIFEVDSNMVVHALDPVDKFPYKQPQMQKVFAAFRQMLLDAMRRGQQGGGGR
jgi:glutathione synthase/RimK-type ligase-like ATP-grasp enzyme